MLFSQKLVREIVILYYIPPLLDMNMSGKKPGVITIIFYMVSRTIMTCVVQL